MSIDHREVNRALAKAIAYKQVGDDAQAERWARELVMQLQCARILDSRAALDLPPYQDRIQGQEPLDL